MAINMSHSLLTLLKKDIFCILGIVLGVLITMRQVGYHNFQKKKTRPIKSFYAFVHTVNGLERIGHLDMLRYLLCILYYIAITLQLYL